MFLADTNSPQGCRDLLVCDSAQDNQVSVGGGRLHLTGSATADFPLSQPDPSSLC